MIKKNTLYSVAHITKVILHNHLQYFSVCDSDLICKCRSRPIRFFTSRGGVVSKTLLTFFLVDQIDFPSSPKSTEKILFWSNFCTQANFHKIGQKGVYKRFYDNFDQKPAFFWRAIPPVENAPVENF